MIYLRTLLILIILIISVVGQENRISVNQIEESYDNINFERAISLSSQALENDESYSAAELVDIYKFRGFAFFHIGNEIEARSSFLTALSISPNLELNEITVSPKIIDFINNLKDQNQELVKNDNVSIEKQYILLDDPRPDSAIRSLVLPGWGQYYKGEQNKAYMVFSTFAVNSAALIVSLIKEKSTHDDYLKARETKEIQSKYNTYNNWYKTRQILTYTEILVWTYAFADVLWFPANKEKDFSLNITPKSFSFTYLF